MDTKEGESVSKCDNYKIMQAVCRENAKVRSTAKLFLLCNGERVSVCAHGEMLLKTTEGKMQPLCCSRAF